MRDGISLIIIDYKSAAQTFACIEHFQKMCSTKRTVNYVIVDNTINNEIKESSLYSDFYKEKNIQEYEGHNVSIGYYKDIEVAICFSNENLGYAKGNNLGFSIAEHLFGNEYVIFSNNDLVFEEGLDVDILLDSFCNENISVVGPDITDLSGKIHQSPYQYMTFWQDTVINYYHMIHGKLAPAWKTNVAYNGESGICDWLSGCFMVVKASDFSKIGGFDPGTFLYGEEIILSERLKNIGKYMWFNNDVRIIHNHSTVVRKKYSEVERLRMNYKSSIYYYSKYKEIQKYKIFVSRVLFELFIPLYLIKLSIKVLLGKLKGNWR